ncbi:hypothetical protein OSB04_017207 [Centaurea solstitialis]|uniref:UBN2 domain-containing protein n=1 Tax=Centaurea solstitialis TaxID=347529 RepID=A0AA38W993_9ASTR|nr:hypothetical protein OSB04_017207 [Centaurea solstitialis]
MESRKIFLVRQYENFIHIKGETLSQIYQRFNCLLIGLKTISTLYSNSEVITKFMKSLLKHWEMYTTCLTMSKDIKTLTLSELYSILLNHEQQKKLKKNLTELDPFDFEVISDSDSDLNDSLTLLTNSFKRYKKNQFASSSSTSTTSSSKDPKYQKLKEKYKKIKSQRKGRGLIAEDHD